MCLGFQLPLLWPWFSYLIFSPPSPPPPSLSACHIETCTSSSHASKLLHLVFLSSFTCSVYHLSIKSKPSFLLTFLLKIAPFTLLSADSPLSFTVGVTSARVPPSHSSVCLKATHAQTAQGFWEHREPKEEKMASETSILTWTGKCCSHWLLLVRVSDEHWPWRDVRRCSLLCWQRWWDSSRDLHVSLKRKTPPAPVLSSVTAALF